MWEFLKISFRNIFRHKRRSVLTGLVMFIGAFLLTISLAYSEGVNRQVFASMISLNTGDIRIVTPDLEEGKEKSLEESLIYNSDEVKSFLTKEPGVKTVSKRLLYYTAMTYDVNMGYGAVYGIEPEDEKDLFKKILPVDEGEFLDPHETNGIYLSRSTADMMGVEPGDCVTLTTQAVEGGTNAVDFWVKGIFKKTAPWLEWTSYVNLRGLQDLLMVNNGVTSIKVTLNDPGVAPAKAYELHNKIQQKFQLKASDWKDTGSTFLGIVAANYATIFFLISLMFFIVGAIVLNTMLMAAYERTREIGMMMAMGTKRYQIIGLFVLEAFLLSTISSGAGIILGTGISAWLGNTGIVAANEALRYMFGGDKAFPVIVLKNIYITYIMVVFLAVMATIYPAWSAARSEPVKALKYV